MEDSEIISLYHTRDERALIETIKKYGKLCNYVAENIIASKEDIEECLNDTYMTVWEKIPPEKPRCFSAYITKIARNMALKRLEYNTALKRNTSFLISITELEDVLKSENNVENEISDIELKEILNQFLIKQKQRDRVIFMKRYWYFDSLKNISLEVGLNEKAISMILFRMRRKLKQYFLEEGIEL